LTSKDLIRKVGYNIQKSKADTKHLNLDEKKIREWILCREKPLYYIYNYVKFEITGGISDYKEHRFHHKLKRYVRCAHKYHNSLLSASRQLGKALAIYTPIPTAHGTYIEMKDIKVGDLILDGVGRPTKVIATTDIMYDRPCYRINFDNNDSVTVDENHIWKISHSSLKFKNKLKTTKEIYKNHEKIKKWSQHTKSRVELPDVVEYNYNEFLPLEPYLLGLWLGDGEKATNRICCHEDDYFEYSLIFDERNQSISDLMFLQGPTKQSGRFTLYGIRDEFRDLNLFYNKHIPDIYLRSSIDNRLELLRGLMDSDGTVMKCGTCQFYQKDLFLFSQVRQLLSSLGIKTRYTFRIIKEQKYHQLTFTTNKYYVFNLPRKRERQNERGYMRENRNVFMSSIEQVESVPVKCIQVENPDGMFLCGHSMIPTHNSTISAAILDWALRFYPNNDIVILNFKKESALENLKKIKFINTQLPDFLKLDFASKSDIKSYADYSNGSSVRTFYPTTVI